MPTLSFCGVVVTVPASLGIQTDKTEWEWHYVRQTVDLRPCPLCVCDTSACNPSLLLFSSEKGSDGSELQTSTGDNPMCEGKHLTVFS